MRRIAPLFLIVTAYLWSAAAQAQTWFCPMTAAGVVSGSTPDGRYWAHWCPDGEWGDWRAAYFVMRSGYTVKHPTLPAGASLADTASAYREANVSFGCRAWPADQPELGRLCDAAYNAVIASKPPSRWIVRPSTTATSRPTYSVVNGVRSTTSNGRASINTNGQPTACYCAASRVVEASVTYCYPHGAPPMTVANCKLR